MEENRLLHRQVLLNSEFEVQNTKLKKEVDVLREENRAFEVQNADLKKQVDILREEIQAFEVQNAEVKKKEDALREENRLRHEIDYHVAQMDRHIWFAETDETE